MAKRKQTDPNAEIVWQHLAEIRARLRQGDKPSAVAGWLAREFGYAGNGATLNGHLRYLPADTPAPQPAASAGRRLAYARVSTGDQHLHLQIDALTTAGVAEMDIYQEKMSGSRADRPELAHALKALRAGDTLVVWRLDRLGRSLPDLVKIVADLEAKGIGFESLTEKIDTTTAAGKLMLHVFAALAEFERNIIRERTHAGLASARARGRIGGRKPALSADQVKQIRASLADPDVRVDAIAKQYGVSRSTIYAHVGAVKPAKKTI